jgi:hypothetical protein
MDHIPGPVRTAVIDKDDLVRDMVLPDDIFDPAAELRQRFIFVIDGYDN